MPTFYVRKYSCLSEYYFFFPTISYSTAPPKIRDTCLMGLQSSLKYFPIMDIKILVDSPHDTFSVSEVLSPLVLTLKKKSKLSTISNDEFQLPPPWIRSTDQTLA